MKFTTHDWDRRYKSGLKNLHKAGLPERNHRLILNFPDNLQGWGIEKS